MPSVGPGVREIRIRQASGAYRIIYLTAIGEVVHVLHAFQKKTQANGQTGHRPRQGTTQTNQVTVMARSVFHDLFSEEEAAELEMRAKLLSGVNKWLNKSGLTQTEAAAQLGVTQARVSEIKNGKINRFSLSMLVRLAQRAGLRPGIKLQKAA